MKFVLLLYIVFISLSGYCTYSILKDTASDGSGDGEQLYADVNRATKYLKQYDYLEDRRFKVYGQAADTRRALKEATARFQKRFKSYGLEVTGELDESTLDLMDMPRCGVSDNNKILNTRNINKLKMRKRRYLITGGKWNKQNFVYKLSKYPIDKDLLPEVVDKEVARAFAQWEQHSTLRFSRSNSISNNETVDFEMMFVPTNGDHGDGNPFDGKEGTFAHAFYPNNPHPLAGDIHFDEAEQWTSGTLIGTNFYQVVTHEIGHSLGLGHSDDPNSVMSPFYNGYIPTYALTSDDIQGIQAIYGIPITTTTTARSPIYIDISFAQQLASRVCRLGYVDAISHIKDYTGVKRILAFQGPYYFIINDNGGMARGYPRKIKDDFPSLADNVDAAFYLDTSTENGATYIFKRDKYWKIVGMNIATDYPKSIKDLEWVISSVDTAYRRKSNGKIYFLKGNQYYRYTWSVGVDAGFPVSISAWNGLPNSKIDASLMGDNGVVYIFSGHYYYAFDQDSTKVRDGYPKDIRKDWLKCDYVGTASTMTGRLLYISVAYIITLLFCHMTSISL